MTTDRSYLRGTPQADFEEQEAKSKARQQYNITLRAGRVLSLLGHMRTPPDGLGSHIEREIKNAPGMSDWQLARRFASMGKAATYGRPPIYHPAMGPEGPDRLPPLTESERAGFLKDIMASLEKVGG